MIVLDGCSLIEGIIFHFILPSLFITFIKKMAVSKKILENINEFINSEVKILEIKSISTLTVGRPNLIESMPISTTRFENAVMVLLCVEIAKETYAIILLYFYQRFQFYSFLSSCIIWNRQLVRAIRGFLYLSFE